jgi:hypothetical protein
MYQEDGSLQGFHSLEGMMMRSRFCEKPVLVILYMRDWVLDLILKMRIRVLDGN